MPAFQRHAEATTQELFFDLCKYHGVDCLHQLHC
jgi:hypothetical protein